MRGGDAISKLKDQSDDLLSYEYSTQQWSNILELIPRGGCVASFVARSHGPDAVWTVSLDDKTEILFAIQYKMLIEKSETRPCKIQEEIDKTVEMWKAENVKYRFPIRNLLIVAPYPGDWGKFFQPGLAYQNETIQTPRSQIKIPDGLIFIVMTKEMLFDLFGKEVVEQVVQIAEKKMERGTQT